MRVCQKYHTLRGICIVFLSSLGRFSFFIVDYKTSCRSWPPQSTRRPSLYMHIQSLARARPGSDPLSPQTSQRSRPTAWWSRKAPRSTAHWGRPGYFAEKWLRPVRSSWVRRLCFMAVCVFVETSLLSSFSCCLLVAWKVHPPHFLVPYELYFFHSVLWLLEVLPVAVPNQAN